MGFPSWTILIENILKELTDKYGETSETNFDNILNNIKSGKKSLFDALNKIENDEDNGQIYKTKVKEYVNLQIEESSINLPDDSAVHELIWKISNKIVTTNYDKVLEKYKPSDSESKIFDNKNVFQGLKSYSETSKFLYKIHGDYENPDSIILFESDYNSIYQNDNHNSDVLSTYFKNKTLLFIGFSLSDPFVNDLFSKIKSLYSGYTVNEHFVFSVKSEDFTSYDINTIKIDDWDKSLIKYLENLNDIKEKFFNDIKSSEIIYLTPNDVNNVVELINKKTKQLLTDPNNKELHVEIKDLRIKLDKQLFGEIDYVQEFNKPFRNLDLQVLFDKIYSSENLDSQTIESIQKIRNNSNTYKWYDRSVIVSSIACSLIHFNKADKQKITLLIDFINDNEEKVWQKAITSLFMALNHLGNKWLRFPEIRNKIKSLNENLKIQNACSTIVQLFSLGLNNISLINEKIFTNSYFSENPFNYFLPFHDDDNPAFNLIYENFEGSNIDGYIKKIIELPIPDQIKYIICGKKDIGKISDRNKQKTVKLDKILRYNSMFSPYSIYVQEIIGFYRFFPAYKHQQKLRSELKLTETPLKDYLLNDKQKYSALGYYFMQEKQWGQAIVNFLNVLKLDKDDVAALLNLASSYHNNKEYNKESSVRNNIEKIEPGNKDNLEMIFHLYSEINKDYNKSLDIISRLIKIDDKNPEYYNHRARVYNEFKKFDQAIIDINYAIGIKSDEAGYYFNRANLYYSIKDYERSLIDWNIAIEINPKNDKYYYSRSEIHSLLNNHLKANEDLNDAIILNKKDKDYFFSRALNNLFISKFDDALKDLQKAEYMNYDKAIIYNCYSNYYRLNNKFDLAFEFISKAEIINNNNNGFTGTKATIYASMGDDKNFYIYFEKALLEGADAVLLFPDIKNKYRTDERFINLLKKYKQRPI